MNINFERNFIQPQNFADDPWIETVSPFIAVFSSSTKSVFCNMSLASSLDHQSNNSAALKYTAVCKIDA
jgi:hypothetical protein